MGQGSVTPGLLDAVGNHVLDDPVVAFVFLAGILILYRLQTGRFTSTGA